MWTELRRRPSWRMIARRSSSALPAVTSFHSDATRSWSSAAVKVWRPEALLVPSPYVRRKVFHVATFARNARCRSPARGRGHGPSQRRGRGAARAPRLHARRSDASSSAAAPARAGRRAG
eukprot:6348934-Prymnesium_polylepis.1